MTTNHSINNYSTKAIVREDKILGIVFDNRLLRKVVSAKRHFLKRPKAIALDRETLDRAEEMGATEIEVVDQDSGKSYYCTIKYFRLHGFKLNRGYGEQIGLTMNNWICANPGDPKQFELFGV